MYNFFTLVVGGEYCRTVGHHCLDSHTEYDHVCDAELLGYAEGGPGDRNERLVTGSYSNHYNGVIMGTMASQITSLTLVYSTVYSGADQRKHQSSASLAFVRGIHRWPVNSLRKWPVTRKMFPFDDVIMAIGCSWYTVLMVYDDHDDVIKWKHFPRYWPFVRGIHRSPVNSPHKGQWRGALMFTLICARINGWVNNREAGDLRRYRAHYDVIVMIASTIRKNISIFPFILTTDSDRWIPITNGH